MPTADPSGTLKIVGDPGPQVGNADSSQDSAALAFAVVRQGASQTRLTDRPQKVLFVKSQATSAKEAIGNLLLSDVGLNLITMALAPQMRMWNPYMNDSIRKGIDPRQGNASWTRQRYQRFRVRHSAGRHCRSHSQGGQCGVPRAHE